MLTNIPCRKNKKALPTRLSPHEQGWKRIAINYITAIRVSIWKTLLFG